MSQATDPPFPPENDQFKERDQGNSVVTVIGIFDITKLDGVDTVFIRLTALGAY